MIKSYKSTDAEIFVDKLTSSCNRTATEFKLAHGILAMGNANQSSVHWLSSRENWLFMHDVGLSNVTETKQ